MGIFASCCKPSAADVITPDAGSVPQEEKTGPCSVTKKEKPGPATETRRRQQTEAAERRAAAEAARGVKDPDALERMRKKTEEMEKRAEEFNKSGGPTLKWTAD